MRDSRLRTYLLDFIFPNIGGRARDIANIKANANELTVKMNNNTVYKITVEEVLDIDKEIDFEYKDI